jgi:hypothetical protein
LRSGHARFYAVRSTTRAIAGHRARRAERHHSQDRRRPSRCAREASSSVGPAPAIVLGAGRAWPPRHHPPDRRRPVRAERAKRHHPPDLRLAARATIRRTSAGRRAAMRDAPPSTGLVPAIVSCAWLTTICQRITVRRPSRLGRGAAPSAGCWLCARTDFCCPKLGAIASKAWSLGINFRFAFQTIEY